MNFLEKIIVYNHRVMEHYPILIQEAGVSQEKQKMLSSSKGMLGKKKKRNTELSKPLRT